MEGVKFENSLTSSKNCCGKWHSKNKIQVDVHFTCASMMYMCIFRLFLFPDP